MTADVQRSTDEAAMPVLEWGWAIRRAIFGLVILAVGVSSMAWLTYASIDPALEPVASDHADHGRVRRPAAASLPLLVD